MTPSLVTKHALTQFLVIANQNTDKYWWKLVPRRTLYSSAQTHLMNAMMSNGGPFHVMMTQMTARAGIKKHGELTIAALVKELSHNLHDKDVIKGKRYEQLMDDQ